MQFWLTQARWIILKDILLTFGGVVIIMTQVFIANPVNPEVLVTGLALSGIGASFHLGALISGFIGRSSSESSSSHGG